MVEGGELVRAAHWRAELPVPDFARVFDEAPAPFLLLTPDLVIVHANRARLEATATTLEETVGRPLFDVFPLNPDDPGADGMTNLRASLERARDTRRPDTMALQKYDIPMPDGSYEERWWSPRNVPILDDAGEVAFLLHRSDDITEYVRGREAARRATARGEALQERVDRVEADLYSRTRELEQLTAQLRHTNERQRRTADTLARLANAVSALAAAEDMDELIRVLFRVGTPALRADSSAVALWRADHRELDVRDDRHTRARPLSATSAAALAVGARGQRVVVAGPRPHLPESPWPGADERLQAWLVLPLRVGGSLVGALGLAWYTAHALDDDDVVLLEAFAAQCAQAVERVTRLEEERQRATATRTLAETLQRSMLTDPPQPDHLQIAVRYRPAAQDAQVGGDWYDAFLTPDAATTLVIGDVTGHDRTAAAAMGQLRNLLRGTAHALDDTPARTLAALDRALHDLGVHTLATAVLARVEQDEADRAAGLRTLRWSNAGHPPPLLLQPDGTGHVLERSADVLLGLLPHSLRADHTVRLLPGATVVLYTDGLVERRGEPLDVGLQRLAEAAGSLSGLPLDDLCDQLLARLAPEADDDIAIVALRAFPEDAPRPAEAGPVRLPTAEPPDAPRHRSVAEGRDDDLDADSTWQPAITVELPTDPSAAGRARRALAAVVAEHDQTVDLDTAALLTSELVSNAVRHGGGSVRMRLLLQRGRLRVEVGDEAGHQTPAVREFDADSEGGRGLWLVEALAARWGTEAHPDGTKDVWFELG